MPEQSPMTEEHLLASYDGPVATLTLNRPELLNALSVPMVTAGISVLNEIAEREDIHVVLVTGAGRSFCAGGDIEAMKAAVDADRADFDMEANLVDQRLAHEFTRLLHDIPKITIAAINGYATGAGLAIALACDLRIAESSSGFGTAFTGVGLDGDLGISWTLTRLVGESKAKELMFFPAPFDVQKAQQLGLVNFVAESEDFSDEVRKLATRLAGGPQVAYRYIKQNINAAHQESLSQVLDREALTHVALGLSDDFYEGVTAFLEKRRPVFGQGKPQ